MSNYKIVTKGVSFNVLDPDQEKILEHAMKRKNFSAYVKRLIYRDLTNTFKPKVGADASDVTLDDNVDTSFMDNLI